MAPPLSLFPMMLIREITLYSLADKHTDYKGLIKLDIREYAAGETIRMVVEDNGNGIQNNKQEKSSDNKKHRSFGLEIIKDRIQLLNEDQQSAMASFQYGNRKNENGFKAEFILPVKLS